MGNFIKNLQNDLEQHRMAKDDCEMAICDLSQYLNSDKFNCGDSLDGYVNVKDVMAHLILIKDALNGRNDDMLID